MWITLLPAGLYSLWAMKTIYLGEPIKEFGSLSLAIGLFVGLASASKSYLPERNENTAPTTLLLPVTELERFVTRIILTALFPMTGPLLILIFLGNLYAFLSGGSAALSNGFIGPDSSFFMSDVPLFVIYHSIVFAGGLFFRENILLKCAISAMGYLATIAVFSAILIGTSILKHISTSMQNTGHLQDSIVNLQSNFFTNSLIVAFVSWKLIAPTLLYVAAYFKASELEVRS